MKGNDAMAENPNDSESEQTADLNVIVNVPNTLSAIRLVIALVVCGLIAAEVYMVALILFIIAAGTDWIDGWWARKYNQVTKLGRILDPFCDKILICGAFILLATKMDSVSWLYSISGVVAVVVVGRELLVTALRSAIEGSGGDFSAKYSAKLKMLFQCLAAGAGLLFLYNQSFEEPIPAWLIWFLGINVWLTLVFTLYSGFEYVIAAARMLRQRNVSEID